MKKFIDDRMEHWGMWIVAHPVRIALADALLSGVICMFGFWVWPLWAHILLAQNFAFTYVSRARNSGSLSRHMKAAFMSNGIWWLSQIIIFSTLFNYITGKGGIPAMLGAGIFYTIFTMSGSLIAHAQALKNEAGKEAVGANKRFHQVTIEEWEWIQDSLPKIYNPCPLCGTVPHAHNCPIQTGLPAL